MKTHLKRIAAPRTWPILRKRGTFVVRPRPSGHTLERTLPIAVVLRDVLGLVQTTRQATRAMRAHEVRVNGTRAWNPQAPVGFMDLLTIGKDAYRLLIDKKNTLVVVPTKHAHSVQRIAGKTSVKSGQTQINCEGGMNFLVKKDAYKTGDSVAIKDGEVTDHFPLAKGAAVLVTGGSHIGVQGNVESVEDDAITITADGVPFQTRKGYAYVIGKEKPAI